MTEQDTLGDFDSTENKGKHVYLTESLQKGTWLYWTLLTTLGATGGSAAFQILRQSSFSFAWIVGLGLFGLVIGLAQSLVLRRVFYQSGEIARVSILWTATSLIGWTTGGIAGTIVTLSIAFFLYITGSADYTWTRQSGYYVHWISFISLGVLTVSIVQRQILYPRINTAEEWTRPSIAGWIAAWAVGLGAAHITPGNELVKAAVGGAIGGVIVGMITGHALARLLAVSLHGDSSP